MFTTGFFGVPGSSKGRHTVHVVYSGKPICGWRPRKAQEFQFCSTGIAIEMIECTSCKRRGQTILRAAGVNLRRSQ